MNFKENVPEVCGDDDSKSCRIDESTDVGLTDVWRFLEVQEPTESSFASHAALGKELPNGVCECRWVSCSLQMGADNAAAAMKLPFLKRFTHRAELHIPQGSGKSYKSGTHVDFWAYDSFSFLSALKNVVRK